MSYCEICEMGDLGREVHNSVIHRMADRIAKLETAVTKFSAAAETEPVATEPKATPAAAGPIPPGYKLADGWTTDGVEDDDTCTRDARCPGHPRYGYRHGSEPRSCAVHAVEMGAIVPVGGTP